MSRSLLDLQSPDYEPILAKFETVWLESTLHFYLMYRLSNLLFPHLPRVQELQQTRADGAKDSECLSLIVPENCPVPAPSSRIRTSRCSPALPWYGHRGSGSCDPACTLAWVPS